MDPSALIPQGYPMPIQAIVLQILLVVTFTLHMLLMNVVLGGSIVAMVAEAKGKGEYARGLAGTGKELSPKLTMSLALAVNLGVAPLLFIQVLYGQFLYTSSVLMAWSWLGIVAIIILAYYGLYAFNFKYEAMGHARIILLGACSVLLLIVAFVLTNNMTLMLAPERWVKYFDSPGGTMLNWSEPSLFPRYLHMVVAALAVGGLFTAAMSRIQMKRGKMTEEVATRRIEFGMRWFTRTTLLQIIVGPIFLMTLPERVMNSFLGGDAINTGLMVVGLGFVVLTIYLGIRRMLWPTVASLGVLVLFMSIIRAFVRIGYLAPYYNAQEAPVMPQYSALTLFLVSLAIGLAAIYWILKQALIAGRTPNTDQKTLEG